MALFGKGVNSCRFSKKTKQNPLDKGGENNYLVSSFRVVLPALGVGNAAGLISHAPSESTVPCSSPASIQQETKAVSGFWKPLETVVYLP